MKKLFILVVGAPSPDPGTLRPDLVGTPLPRWLPVGWDAALVAPSPLSIPVAAWWVMVMRNNIGPVIVVNESDLLLQLVPGLPLRLS